MSARWTWAAAAACAALVLGCKGDAGTNGTSGATSLVVTAAEAPGANCAYGGTRIDSGPDANSNGVLDASEIVSTQYVCNVDTRDPAVLSVTPEPGPIANDATFAIAFSEAMDATTIDGTTLFLTPQGGSEAIPATVTYDDATHTATLAPRGQLLVDTIYELHVTTDARDPEGNALAAAGTYTYEIARDVLPPRVVELRPADGGRTGPSSDVGAVFDEPLNESGQVATITLADATGAPVAGSSGWNEDLFVFFAPAQPLEDGKTYTATIDAIVADKWGNWDRVTQSWSFSVDATPTAITGPPVASPATQAVGGSVEITVPVDARARAVDVYIGTDAGSANPWWAPLGSVSGNEQGEGSITGTFTVPVVPAAGSYSIWIIVSGDNGTSSLWLADSSVSAVNYAMQSSSTTPLVESTIPLAFLGVTDAKWVNLTAALEFVPGAPGAGELRYTFTNSGTGDAGPFVAGIYVNGGVPQLYELPDDWLDFDALPAGTSAAGTIAVIGHVRLRAYAFADLTASVAETVETDNLASAFYGGSAGTPYLNTLVVPINDGATSTSSTIVTGGPTSVADVTVTLNITHTWDGDLRIALTSPSGRSVLLVNRRGSGGENFTSTVLDDTAETRIASGTAPFTGTFLPEEPLSAFAGEDANGTWTLEVSDMMGSDVGSLDGWTLTLW